MSTIVQRKDQDSNPDLCNKLQYTAIVLSSLSLKDNCVQKLKGKLQLKLKSMKKSKTKIIRSKKSSKLFQKSRNTRGAKVTNTTLEKITLFYRKATQTNHEGTKLQNH